MRLVAEALGVSHQFPVANTLWINGTVDRMLPEILPTFMAILIEKSRPLAKWMELVLME